MASEPAALTESNFIPRVEGELYDVAQLKIVVLYAFTTLKF
jgi:hypothetical protein